MSRKKAKPRTKPPHEMVAILSCPACSKPSTVIRNSAGLYSFVCEDCDRKWMHSHRFCLRLMEKAGARGVLQLIGITSGELAKEYDFAIGRNTYIKGRKAPWNFELACRHYPDVFEPFRDYFAPDESHGEKIDEDGT